ncbi:hypothetical protein CBR_g2950 [Chara braunii]|uniref:Uncharacterized protein n=1 Tax=Chara braunii TaxID=69332 RepID=A0A388KEB9_CHABU|nr:hypothetical protein CBR_g2950 [Chara braunii]|eukprot:GBG68405.1 hypothetical protein CBR_g2950 [Chara braunii]
MASARVFLLMVCVAMVFSCSAAAPKDLWTTLLSDQRFSIITKGFKDIEEVQSLKDRADGSVPFVFVAQTDDNFMTELGGLTVACMTSPSQVKNSFAQILRFLQVPVAEPVKTAADLAALAKKTGNKLPTVNGMPIVVESEPSDSTVLVSGDESSMDNSAMIAEVIEINPKLLMMMMVMMMGDGGGVATTPHRSAAAGGEEAARPSSRPIQRSNDMLSFRDKSCRSSGR